MKLKWDYKSCYEEAKKYSSRSEFKKENPVAYRNSLENKWIDDYTWLERKHTRRGFWQNHDNCLNESKKYKTRNDFQKGAPGAYKSSSQNGWLDEFFPKTE